MMFALLLLTTLVATASSVPVPNRPVGFSYAGGRASAGVQLEAYIDLLCPDSKAAFPGLRSLAGHYAEDQLRIQFVLFPLPYHQHAFAAAEATYTITSALGDGAFDQWVETMYNNQDMFWNEATKELSPVQVSDKLFELASQTFPELSRKQWEEGMNGYGGTFADHAARLSWKYTCTRGMSGTPLYTLNGVPFDADSTWTLSDWKKVIDPLVEANAEDENDSDDASTPEVTRASSGSATPTSFKSSTPEKRPLTKLPDRRVIRFSDTEEGRLSAGDTVCAHVRGGHRPCEFAVGQAMCCGFNEACVLNTGCVPIV